MGSSLVYNTTHPSITTTTTPSCFVTLEQQLQELQFDVQQGEIRQARLRTLPSSIDQLETFQIGLYLSLIPRDLVPKHLFTISPQTGNISLNRATDRTIEFLDRLEPLWQVADFDEDVVLGCIVRVGWWGQGPDAVGEGWLWGWAGGVVMFFAVCVVLGGCE